MKVAKPEGGQVCTLQWPHLCLQNSLKIANKISQFSQYLGTKLDMLFEIANSVQIIIILEKKNSYFTLTLLISCKNTIVLLPWSTKIYQKAIVYYKLT